MQWTIQMKDKQIAIISEKLNSHLVLFSSVQKEVAAVKQVLGDVHCLVGEKENVGMAMIARRTSFSPVILAYNFVLIIMFPCLF
jgi:hypothetical protein